MNTADKHFFSPLRS